MTRTTFKKLPGGSAFRLVRSDTDETLMHAIFMKRPTNLKFVGYPAFYLDGVYPGLEARVEDGDVVEPVELEWVDHGPFNRVR